MAQNVIINKFMHLGLIDLGNIPLIIAELFSEVIKAKIFQRKCY